MVVLIKYLMNEDKNREQITYTQNGSYPSCKPHVVKNFKVFTSCPNVNFAFCPTPSVKAGTKESPCTSAKDVSPPSASISNSPFKEKPRWYYILLTLLSINYGDVRLTTIKNS